MNLAHDKQGVLVLTCLSHIECWPYPVIKNLNCDAIVVVFIMATAVLASMISIGIWYNPQLPSNFQCHIEILLDNSEGNTMGWNSNGIRISFTIVDDQFNLETSTVHYHHLYRIIRAVLWSIIAWTVEKSIEKSHVPIAAPKWKGYNEIV